MEAEPYKKPRPPIEQLRKAGNIARQSLRDRGLLPKKSFIDFVEKKHRGLLPGLPAYLPERPTIMLAQRMMFDLLKMWQQDNKDNQARMDNLVLFIEFAVKELTSYMEIADKEKKVMRKMIDMVDEVPLLGDVFRPINKFEHIRGIRAFYVDSFAKATWIDKLEDTGRYAAWFMKWTKKLNDVWDEWPEFVKQSNGPKQKT